MRISTLAYFFKNDQILLGMKKRDFGKGKWNGYGGKLEEQENPLDAVVREIKEESGIEVDKDACKELGYIDFYFDDKEEWNQRVVIFRIDEFKGEPEETEEMTPSWFKISDLPYHQMWQSDGSWFPYLIEGKKFRGEIYLTDNGQKVVRCEILLV